jgi:predicted GNAT family acetyltransferase
MMTERKSSDVLDNAAESRFELALDGNDVAFANYRRTDSGALVIPHTEVPPAYRGQGIAGILAQGVFAIARARGIKLILRCSYMSAWLERHPDYADVVARKN